VGMVELAPRVVSVKDLSFAYPGDESVLVLTGVTFEVFAGEILSVLGPSGCGKTTLIKLVLGQLAPLSGSVEIDDEIRNAPFGGIAYIPQAPILLPWRTALQNSTLDLELGKTISQASILKVRTDFQEFGLEGAESLYPDELSGGMKQRVALIRGLSTSPKIVCADEPFSALDYISRIHLNRRFKHRCNIHGVATIFVTHNVEEAVYLSTKILLLSDKPRRGSAVMQITGSSGEDDPIAFRQSSEFLSNVRNIWRAMESQVK
jgi:NitT/TauT family transport system ATP-binding protein